MFYKLIKHC